MSSVSSSATARGANGKSTLLNVIHKIIGDYGVTMPLSALSTTRDLNTSNDIARMKGKRMALESETEKADSLAEAQIKALTGGDPIAARFLYKEHFEFVPVAKIFVSTNHLPVISGTDEGIWRRIKTIPFDNTVPVEERDPELSDKLWAEREGIFAWAVEGARQWQSDGLQEPEAAKGLTSSYRSEMDPVHRFIETELVACPASFTSTQELETRLDYWAMQETQPMDITKLRAALNAKGIRTGRKGGKRGFIGIKPKISPRNHIVTGENATSPVA